jgi:hypothetical protein
MATPSDDSETHRKRQRRRALIGWGGALAAIVVVVVLIAAGGGSSHHRRDFKVPYGEVMTSKEYAAIDEGEEAADVLEGLGASGRPERLTEKYVLDLFPPAEEEVYCTYWEFSDKPQIFARLCFDRSTDELVQKLKHSALHPLTGGQGQVV